MNEGKPRVDNRDRAVDRVRSLCQSLVSTIESLAITEQEAVSVAQEIERLRESLPARALDSQERAPATACELLVGDCPQIRLIKSYLAKVARVDSTVLITGETGTGKQLVAEMIHGGSTRRERPFISVNCAALPENLLESELFGYEKGAFTGAASAKRGKIELADGGTFFLDEIGDMNLVAQAKLLRVLESGELERLGAQRSQRFNVRFIAATNHDLEAMVGRGTFRKDLYYRLNIARIHLPPLRERRADVPLLLKHYGSALNERLGLHAQGFAPEAIERLSSYEWPGNVRELKNLVESILVHRPTGMLDVEDLPAWCRGQAQAEKAPAQEERELLISALTTTNWNVSKAAYSLQWSRMTLYRKMAKHRINRPPLSDIRPPPPL